MQDTRSYLCLCLLEDKAERWAWLGEGVDAGLLQQGGRCLPAASACCIASDMAAGLQQRTDFVRETLCTAWRQSRLHSMWGGRDLRWQLQGNVITLLQHYLAGCGILLITLSSQVADTIAI